MSTLSRSHQRVKANRACRYLNRDNPGTRLAGMKRHTSPTLRKFARSRKLKLSWRIVDREGIEPELRGAYRVIKVGRACPIVISDARHDLPLGVLGDLGCVEMEEWLRRVQDENLLIAFVPRHLEQLLSEAGFPLSTAGSAFDDRMLEINGLKL